MKRRQLLLAVVGIASLGAIGACASSAPPASALRVVTSGGFASAYQQILPGFEAATGMRVTTEYGASTGGAPDSIPERLARGERFDVVILSRESLDRLTEAGYVRPASRTDLVRSLIGMAVMRGAEAPDISTPERFVEVLKNARSIGYSASVSGNYLATDLLPRLGLWEELEPKCVRIESDRVAAVVARGEVAIGFQQVSEILSVAGAALVGPIPAEYQKVSTFSAGVTERAANAEAAGRLIDYLASAAVAPAIAENGLEPVALEL